MSLAECQNNPIDVNFHMQTFLEMFDKNQLTHSDPKRKGVGKCPRSCQLGQKQLLPLFSECEPSACPATNNRECDGSQCKCKSGFLEDPAITNPGPNDACVAGRKTLTTDEANPQVSKDLEKCQKSHISS